MRIKLRQSHVCEFAFAVLWVALPAAANDELQALRALKAGIEAVQVEIPSLESERLIEELRSADTTLYSQDLDRSLSKLCAEEMVAGAHPLKFKNKEIEDFVLETYIATVQAERAYEKSLRDGVLENVVPTPPIDGHENELDESGLEFLDGLAALAESTLSEKLYEYIWDFPQPSPYRQLYVASVLPERTIARFIGAQRGRTAGGVSFAQDSLFAYGYILGTSIQDALVHLANITALNPDLAQSKRDDLVSLVVQYGLHYAHPSEKYEEWRDYIAREAAMKILAGVGDNRELPLLEKLAINVPVVHSSIRIKNPQNLDVLAETVKAALASRK